MSFIKKPPELKETPTTRPELMEQWQRMYEELITEYPKSTSLQMVGDRWGVSRTTVTYHLFPDYKEKQRKRHSIKWSYEKQNPIIRKRIVEYKARYMAARNHIDRIIRDVYEQSSQHTMNLEDLAYAVHDVSGIFFKPATILGLSKKHATVKGYQILVEVPGHKIPHYKISEEAKKKY